MEDCQIIEFEITPSSGSVEVPEKVTRLPSEKLSPSSGVLIDTVGGTSPNGPSYLRISSVF